MGDRGKGHSGGYVFHLGEDISHPGYGMVSSGTYTLGPGTYIGTIEHIGGNLQSPEYHYVAELQQVGGTAKVIISDPSGGYIHLYWCKKYAVCDLFFLFCDSKQVDLLKTHFAVLPRILLASIIFSAPLVANKKWISPRSHRPQFL